MTILQLIIQVENDMYQAVYFINIHGFSACRPMISYLVKWRRSATPQNNTVQKSTVSYKQWQSSSNNIPVDLWLKTCNRALRFNNKLLGLDSLKCGKTKN